MSSAVLKAETTIDVESFNDEDLLAIVAGCIGKAFELPESDFNEKGYLYSDAFNKLVGIFYQLDSRNELPTIYIIINVTMYGQVFTCARMSLSGYVYETEEGTGSITIITPAGVLGIESNTLPERPTE